MLDKLTQWDGSFPPLDCKCNYAVDFTTRPVPAQNMNSLESGKVMLSVMLSEDGGEVSSVSATIINNAKIKLLENTQGVTDDDLKKNTTVSAILKQEQKRWFGELSIPINWVEGATESFEKTGSFRPASDVINFQLNISYKLQDGSQCMARFYSLDAYHWDPKQDKPLAHSKN